MDRTGLTHRVVQSNAEQLPFTSGAFEVVTAGYLLKYVQLDRFFREVARVLRPGGRFGGYDFSRPVRGTAAGRLYSVYLHQVLPRVGVRGSSARDAWRSVFDFLPEVAETSGWEERVTGSLTRAGFSRIELVPSLGGAISWVWARKGGS
jgi:ubiquinone/menaquinone biosynthesis C-methylase UbiE